MKHMTEHLAGGAEEVVASLDWPGIEAQLNQEGYAVVPNILQYENVCDIAALLEIASADQRVLHASGDFGCVTSLHLTKQLAALVVDLQMSFYKHLLPVANRWNEALGESHRNRVALGTFAAQSHTIGQIHSLSSLNSLQSGDFQALHQHTDGEPAFPMQVVALLSAPGKEFTGGEFVMTEQRPRMQSRPMVLPLRKGDVAIITVAQRPHRGTKGFYRVNLKHGISRVHSGERFGLELLLHDARHAP